MARSVPGHLTRTTALCVLGSALWLSGCSGAPEHKPAVGTHRSAFAFAVNGHGTADITWSGAAAGTVAHATLPWHTTVQQATGAHPVTLAVVLGQRGGHATCAIAIDGRRVSTALAQGKFGRATCQTSTATATATATATGSDTQSDG